MKAYRYTLSAVLWPRSAELTAFSVMANDLIHAVDVSLEI